MFATCKMYILPGDNTVIYVSALNLILIDCLISFIEKGAMTFIHERGLKKF